MNDKYKLEADRMTRDELIKELRLRDKQLKAKSDECEELKDINDRLKAIAPMVECPHCEQYSRYWIDSFSERVDEGRSTIGYIYKCWHCGEQFCDENMETPLKLEQENTALKRFSTIRQKENGFMFTDEEKRFINIMLNNKKCETQKLINILDVKADSSNYENTVLMCEQILKKL